MLLRFGDVNQKNQNLFEVEFKATAGEYLNLLFNQTTPLVEQFLELSLDNNQFSISVKNRKRTKELKNNLELIRAKLDSLDGGIKVFFNLEYKLRDDAIVLHEQINLLEQVYQHNVETFGQSLNLDAGLFQKKLAALYQRLSVFETQIKLGAYVDAQTILKDLNLEINQLNFLVSEYPVLTQYLKFDLEGS